MNAVTERFAAMAERARQLDQQATREHQSTLDAAGAAELESIERDPPKFQPRDAEIHEPSGRPSTFADRARAIAYVTRLIFCYEQRRRGYGYKVNLTAVIDNLRRELALMQAAGPAGETLARRWDFLCGDVVT